jgi:hypothetical protein
MKTKTKRFFHKILYIFWAGLLSQNIYSQQNPNSPEMESLRFLKLEADSISNLKVLYSFFQALSHTDSQSVVITHIGDSHIQGDFITDQLRKSFQHDFGNAGRGLLFPYQVARTNGAISYKSSSGDRWEVNKIILPISSNTNGLAGISISSKMPKSYLLFQMKDAVDSNIGSVSRLKIIYKAETDGSLKIKDWTNNDSVYILNYSTYIDSLCIAEVSLPTPTNNFAIEFLNTGEKLFYGCIATNNKAGIIYNQIGINGAEFRHYNQNSEFFRQLPYLDSKLLIISMGTNEAQDWKRSNEEIKMQMHTFIDSLNYYHPNTTILLTAPIESWRGRGRRRGLNIHCKRVRDCIIEVARERQVAVWDLYTIAGGYKSSFWWRRSGLFSRDMVHHSVSGYRLQGNLLYKALMDGYHQYQLENKP